MRIVREMSLSKAGMDVALSAAGVPGIGSVVELVGSLLDPDRRIQLAAMITDYVLSELPRMKRLLEQRCQAIEASGCSPVEAQIIAFQTIEAQKRTLDDEKRRLLTNVLVNGLCVARWNKAKHRLLIRLTSELEPEHIERLRQLTQRNYIGMRRWPELSEEEESERLEAWREITPALTGELVARGLIDEKLESKRSGARAIGERAGDLKLETKHEIAKLGRELLDHLRDPDDGHG